MKRFVQNIRGCAACVALLLAACEHAPAGPGNAFLPSERFPIAVEAQMATFRLALAGGDLDGPAQSELQNIAYDYVQNGSGSIAVAVPGNDRVVATRITDRLVALGVKPDRIMIANDNGAVQGTEARVSFVRYHADPPTCRNWSENLGTTYDNKPPPNFGCATQHNLAVMVADPHDLVAPKTVENGDVQRSLTVLDKYRKGTTTETTKAGDQTSTVATVGGGM